MITYNLNTEDVANLIKTHLCEDLQITNLDGYSVISSDSDNFYGYVVAFTEGQPVITKEDYDNILASAKGMDNGSFFTELDSTPLFITVTPDGVFQYDLSLLKLEFENYADHSAGIDVDVADLNVSNGVQILEWYPEFASEDEYVDALMSGGDANGFDESETW